MKNGKNEFFGLLCNLYMIALLVVLPLYTGQGYWQLGNTKYTLFYNVSMLCLGVWLLAGMPGRIGAFVDALRGNRGNADRSDGKGETEESGAGERGTGESSREGKDGGSLARFLAGSFSKVDMAVAVYGICVVVSAVCSPYGALAWEGYDGWFMGAVSQLMFVGIYFFVSRQCDGAAWSVYLGEAAFFTVTLFGLLHKLGIDPLGLQYGWNSGDWEYSHMLSTLGNINWLCGFYSVALAFPMVHFLQERRRWFRVLLYVEVTAAFVLLGIQGSQGGLLILAVCVVVCGFLGRKQRAVLRKICFVLAGFFACMPLMWLLMKLRGSKAAVIRDGNVFEQVEWYIWLIAALVSLLLAFWFAKGKAFHKCTTTNGEKKPRKRLRNGVKIGILSGTVALAVLLMVFVVGSVDDSFGSGRGLLWRIALESFCQSDMQDKLFGAGPDCYGVAVFDKLGADTDVWNGEHWEGAVFTNAHNEFLSQLCNVGLLGAASYLAIFLAGLCNYSGCIWEGSNDGYRESSNEDRGNRNVSGREDSGEARWNRDANQESRSEERRNRDVSSRENRNGSWESIGWLGILAIAMYGAHSLISFQQVLNTPLFFLVLGLCEAGMRDRAVRDL